jgi:RND family efflux transporter MFP subunit
MFTRVLDSIVSLFQTIIQKIRGYERRHWIGFTIIVIALSFGAGFLLRGHSAKTELEATELKTRAVKVASVASLSEDYSPLPVVGKVTSISEARIRTESSGVVRLYRKLGDYISAGGIIGELENGAERAALLQAQGAYDASLAQRDITNISSGSAADSLIEAKNATKNTLGSAYSSFDDAVRSKADQLFTNPRSPNPIMNLTVSDNQLQISLQAERLKIEDILKSELASNQSINANTDLVTALTQMQSDAQYIKDFFDDLNLALNKSLPTNSMPQSAIDAYKLSIAGARSAVIGVLSSLSAAKDNLNLKTTQAAIAQKQGSATGSTRVAEANLTQMLGNLRAAQARLEKTIIRSPISGTIISLPLSDGDVIGAFQDAAIVSNSGALEIVTAISESDAGQILAGNKVTIEGVYQGIVTKVAGAVDPLSRKMEVKIGITDKKSTLVNGQSVRLSIERGGRSGNIPTAISIPISALKITPTGSIVFTVAADNTLVAHPITEGALLGEKVLISGGLTPDMQIVTDARGLKAGDTVEVQSR